MPSESSGTSFSLTSQISNSIDSLSVILLSIVDDIKSENNRSTIFDLHDSLHMKLTDSKDKSMETFVVLLAFLIICASSIDLDKRILVPEQLLSAIQAAAGVYIHPKTHSKNSSESIPKHLLRKTVVVTACNYGYLNHFHNLKCFLDRLDIKILVIAMDAKTHSYLQNIHGISSFYFNDSIAIKETSTKFRSEQFNLISNRKIEGVYLILAAGYDVIFVDPDIAVVRDPTLRLFYPGVDYIHSHNKICPQSYDWDFYKSEEEGNTGFYYARSNSKTLSLFNESLAAAPK